MDTSGDAYSVPEPSDETNPKSAPGGDPNRIGTSNTWNKIQLKHLLLLTLSPNLLF